MYLFCNPINPGEQILNFPTNLAEDAGASTGNLINLTSDASEIFNSGYSQQLDFYWPALQKIVQIKYGFTLKI